MLLFQLYPKSLKSNIPGLVNVMMEALALRPPPLQSIASQQPIDNQLKRMYFSRSRELVAAQVKTLSFLTHLLRTFRDHVKAYEDRIATNVVTLMSTCPREAVASRRELLAATRHILASDFRKGFFRHIDSMLDERILMGPHHRPCVSNVLNPLGYSTLAEFVHHVRTMLSMRQLSRVIYTFSRVLHDVSMDLPMSIQITAVRLLQNLVDIVYLNKDTNPQVGRDLLDRILDALVNKLWTLQFTIARVLASEGQRSARGDGDDSVSQGDPSKPVESDSKPEPMDVEMTTDGGPNDSTGTTRLAPIVTTAPVATPMAPEPKSKDTVLVRNTRSDAAAAKQLPEPSGLLSTELSAAATWMVGSPAETKESVKDLQTIVRSIVVGLKTVIWCINTWVPKSKDRPEEIMVLSKLERDLVDKYISCVLPCLRIVKEDDPNQLQAAAMSPASSSTTTSGTSTSGTTSTSSTSSPSQSSSPQTATQRYNEVLMYFAAVFTSLDRSSLHHTLGKRIPTLVEAVVDDPSQLSLFWHILASNQRSSYEFCDILLHYLVENMEDLSPVRPEGYVFVQKWTGNEPNDHERLRKRALDVLLGDETVTEGRQTTKVTEDSTSDGLGATKSTARQKRADVLLDLFERVLKSSSIFPENEYVLRQNIQIIVANCLRRSMETGSNWPDNYCALLRYVFRCVSAGKFENSYKEIFAMIPTILNGFQRIMAATEHDGLRHTIIELSLTIPARLSSLLPHMPLLLRMIVPALQSHKGDLVNLG